MQVCSLLRGAMDILVNGLRLAVWLKLVLKLPPPPTCLDKVLYHQHPANFLYFLISLSEASAPPLSKPPARDLLCMLYVCE